MRNNKNRPLCLEQLLNQGSENAIKGERLTRYYGIGRREFQKMVQADRDNGIPIISKKNEGGGFYLPESQDEFRGFIKRWESQIQTQLDTLNALIERYELEYNKPYIKSERVNAAGL